MITSPQNVQLKALRRARRERGLLLLEGPHLVAEALDAGRVPDTVLVTETFSESETGQRLLRRLAKPPLLVGPGLLSRHADSDAPRGIVAVAAAPGTAITDLPVCAGGVYLYLDGLQDPGNVGALARVAEAAGVAGLLLAPGTVLPHHPRALRASAGSLLRLPVATDATPQAVDEHLESVAPRWLALAAHDGDDLYTTPLAGTVVLALGAEGPGLSERVEARADRRLTLPLAPPVESLNVTVAAALVLFERQRQLGQ